MDVFNRKVLSICLVIVLILLGCSSEPPAPIKSEFRNDAFSWSFYVLFKINNSSPSIFKGVLGPNGEVSDFLYCIAKNEDPLILPDAEKERMLSNSWGCRYRMFFFDRIEYCKFTVRCSWPDERSEKTMEFNTIIGLPEHFHEFDYLPKKRSAPDPFIPGPLDSDKKPGLKIELKALPDLKM